MIETTSSISSHDASGITAIRIEIEHTVRDLVAQRVFAIALGYEDLNDHDELRRDPLLASVVGKKDPTGAKREGASLAASSTLNRLELSRPGEAKSHRYKRVELDGDAVDDLLLNLFVDSFSEPPDQIVLDFDATDAPLHGKQEGRFFHGYYGHHCYMPLYAFCGDHVLIARLRRSNIDGAAGTVDELRHLARSLREYWPDVTIIIRGDSGFCRDEIMSWCESNKVHYVLGLARNSRLERRIREQQLFCFADRVSAHEMRANQVRLYFSAVAYALLERIRRIGLRGTELERAQCNTIRTKLLKIGAVVRITVRKVWVSMSSAFPRASLIRLAISRLQPG